MFGPVALGKNRCDEDLPALLGCAEEGPDEAPTLGGLQDGMEGFRMESQCTNWLEANKALEIKLCHCEHSLSSL